MTQSLKEQVEQFKAERVLLALVIHDFSRVRTAAYLGMTREGLYKLILRLDIEVPTSPDRVLKKEEW